MAWTNKAEADETFSTSAETIGQLYFRLRDYNRKAPAKTDADSQALYDLSADVLETEAGNFGVEGGGSLSGPLTENLDAGGFSITNLVDPSGNQDAATKKYVDDNSGGGGVGDFMANGSVPMTGDFNAGGFQVTNVGGTGSAGLDLKFDTHYNMAIGPDTILPTGGAGSATTNTAVGGGTLGGVAGSPSSVSGYANTAVGASALGRVTSAHNNTAVGTNAGGLITTGLENVAVGQDSLVHLTTGSQFAAVGVDALNQAAGGNSCSALGHQAGQGITTGSDVVAVGQDSAHGHTTGDNSVYVGSGSKTTTGSVSGVVAVGYGAQVTATGQICIGAKGDFRPCIISASGAPSNGSHVDGSLYIRQDGGAMTTLYYASGGSWTGIV